MSTCPKPEPFVLDPRKVFRRYLSGNGAVTYVAFDPAKGTSHRATTRELETLLIDAELRSVLSDLVGLEISFGRHVHRAYVDAYRIYAARLGRTAEFTDCPPAIDPDQEWAMMSVSAREATE